MRVALAKCAASGSFCAENCLPCFTDLPQILRTSVELRCPVCPAAVQWVAAAPRLRFLYLEAADAQNPVLSEILNTLAKQAVVETVATNCPLSIFSEDREWQKEIPQELKQALASLVQSHPKVTFEGGFAPDFYLWTSSKALLGLCWSMYCDGFPGWVSGLFCATPLFSSPTYAFIEEASPGGQMPNMKLKVERWDLEDDLDVWVECPTIWDVQYREGRGMGCGNGRFSGLECSFALRPVGLFSTPPSDRFDKQSRHNFFTPSN